MISFINTVKNKFLLINPILKLDNKQNLKHNYKHNIYENKIMSKEATIDLIIGKCFSKSKLTEKEIKFCESLTTISLLEYGLNENQINLIFSWIKLQQNTKKFQDTYEKQYEK